ncbi:alkaline phosphatase family protein [Pedococcus sp. NPDC057267]|uniref:alkaline phosphatase family protein n=1 Tax=Pedococcus sp. NPDC057267 TaxID=3346077 RepID=UPI00362D00F6
MRHSVRQAAVLGTAALALAAVAPAAAAHASPARSTPRAARKHVLLVSVDGMHQSDLDWYARSHPGSALARLAHSGTSFTRAQTPFPSDSFPGMTALVTGGNPRSTGVYYDVSYNHALLPAGTTDCAHAMPGADVAYDETLDKDPSSLDAGEGLSGLPQSILSMTGKPATLLDPAHMPVDPTTCAPVYPHSYLEVNTVFEVARAAGLRTAWSDKHSAYDLVNGPSGSGVDDLFTPEINSDAPGGGDWTSDNAHTQQYDAYKVQAVLNEIDGKDHSGRTVVGTPAVFGLNFQSVSTAQKLPTSDGLEGGYLPGGRRPGPLLAKALDFVDASVGRMESQLTADGLARSTTIILTAKHGQSPTDPGTLTRIDDGPVIDGIDAGWAATHPGAAPLVAAASDDDGMLIWTSDRSAAATAYVRSYLLAHPATGNTLGGGTRTLPQSGLRAVYAGSASAAYFGVPQSDPRHPDVVGLGQHGVVFTGGTKKIAEHGGADWQDRNVPLVVAPGTLAGDGHTVADPVETTQVAPTILALLGLRPSALQAVDLEHTRTLPAALAAAR